MKKKYSYFLPQFYPTPENDKFWGKGFTEWTNVNNAKPLFKGHKQKYQPGELGEYDLSDPKALEKVIKYSEKINLDGLIYWHYWFGDDFKTLEKIQEEHLKNKKIKQNFCFAWANGDWTKSWKGDDKTIIFKQLYSQESANSHFKYLKQFFKDDRYIKVSGNFLFQVNNVITREVIDHMRTLDNLTKTEFGNRIHFLVPKHILKFSLKEFKCSFSSYPPGEIYSPLFTYKLQKIFKIFKILKRPIIINKKSYIKSFEKFIIKNPKIIPCILSGWDNTPRYKYDGVVIDASISELMNEQISIVNKYSKNHNFILIKAFNEWAEGNILEPYRQDGVDYKPGELLQKLII